MGTEKSKIAFVGSARATRHLAPFNDPSWEIWGVSSGITQNPRVDVHFELHSYDWIKQQMGGQGDLIFELVPRLRPRMVVAHPTIPDRFGGIPFREFPFADLRLWAPRPYFTSSFAWLFGYALWLHRTGQRTIERIGAWGFEMTSSSSAYPDYGIERPCAEYWLSKFEDDGIAIDIPELSPLLKGPFLYGLETDLNDRTTQVARARFEVLGMHLSEAEHAAIDLRQAIGQMHARLDEIDQERSPERVQAIRDHIARYQADLVIADQTVLEQRARIDESVIQIRHQTISDGPIRLARVV